MANIVHLLTTFERGNVQQMEGDMSRRRLDCAETALSSDQPANYELGLCPRPITLKTLAYGDHLQIGIIIGDVHGSSW